MDMDVDCQWEQDGMPENEQVAAMAAPYASSATSGVARSGARIRAIQGGPPHQTESVAARDRDVGRFGWACRSECRSSRYLSPLPRMAQDPRSSVRIEGTGAGRPVVVSGRR